MSELISEPSIVEIRSARIEDAHRPGGILHRIAIGLVAAQTELNPRDVGDLLFPPRQPGDEYYARWQLVEGVTEARKVAFGTHKEGIMELAAELDMSHPEPISEEDLHSIDKHYSLWLVEGGANRTSVVRRDLAIQTMERVYDGDLMHKQIFQFGSDRLISRLRTDGSENPEYKVALEIAGPHFPVDKATEQPKDEITEFELNVASAYRAGFRPEHAEDEAELEDAERLFDHIERLVTLRRVEGPDLTLIQPKNKDGGLMDGFDAAVECRFDTGQETPLTQPVIFTNGQYRPKDELQAEKWARQRGINIIPPLAIGDEPGFKVVHGNKDIVTADRPPAAFINEMVILHRLSQ